ncbi:hypothetical protein [Bradyrhizobium sp. NAS80.1]|uniref:hypothetical protein n=1 Tax=Bradyrhizobium sp. NAS80.1 TaxID=1680159 RepID=UPI001FDA82F3|nr:hypothetical protein [Bradyrhizobium sp. NAS80.1]
MQEFRNEHGNSAGKRRDRRQLLSHMRKEADYWLLNASALNHPPYPSRDWQRYCRLSNAWRIGIEHSLTERPPTKVSMSAIFQGRAVNDIGIGMTSIDDRLSEIRSVRNDIWRCRKLLRTELPDADRNVIEKHLLGQRSAFERLLAMTFPLTFRF